MTGAGRRVHANRTFTPDEALHLVRCGTMGTDEWQQAVAQRMVDTDCCVWHAVHQEAMARYADGRLPTDTCTLCGGRNRGGWGDHGICTARARLGKPTPPIDYVAGLVCDCAACVDERKAGAA